MKVVAIVQARMGSMRLPDKVMKPINGVPMIGILLKRLSAAEEVDQVLVATTIDSKNLPLIEYVKSLGYVCEIGSEKNVLERYILAAEANKADLIVRITGDCPLLDSKLVDDCIRSIRANSFDYFSNVDPPTYPDGLDVEVVTLSALKKAQLEVVDDYDKEHVTSFIRNSDFFLKGVLQSEKDFSGLRWTVDEPEDFEVVSNVFNHFKPFLNFSWQAVIELNQIQPELFSANLKFVRNSGATIGAGQKLWQRAKRVIPGGNMLLSKRSEMFLPDLWPSYFSKAKGCKVWDLDGKEYIDMSLMGVGTNILGYGHPEVDAAIMDVVKAGNMSTLNCSEEVLLAEKLVELHPWADMVRLARTGGEANAMAIRIARAASGKDNVAICGYHGWHDWYLSANLSDDASLDGHLLAGLQPNGVPRNLKGTVFPFNYNNFSELESLVKERDIGVIKMEVVRNKGPEDNFLKRVRKLATDHNIVLIFDECTSGFRETFGGLHKKYDVEPDMAIFGKALGNGYSITAAIGKRSVMEAAQTTFMSSTFWTERIGPAAALATLKVMEQVESWNKITEIGLNVRNGWQQLAKKHNLNMNCWGLPSLTGFTFQSKNMLAYKTLISQEMLSKGFLAGNSVYACIDHTQEVVEHFFHHLDPIFGLIKECEEGRDIVSLLKGPISHAGFKRLN